MAGRNQAVRWWILAASVAALVSCRSARPALTEADPAAASIADLLRAEFDADLQEPPTTPQQAIAWNEQDCVVVLVDRPRAPIADLDDDTRLAIAEYVRGGGRLLLLGFAARLAYELGLEPEPPSRFGDETWGRDDRTAIGLFQFGFCVQDDTRGLSRDMRPFPRRPDAFLFGGGEGASAQLCLWEDRLPRAGQVLARACALRDASIEDDDAAVIVSWKHGSGEVLACGFVPEPSRSAPAIAENARRFLRNAMGALLGEREHPGSVAFCVGKPRDGRDARDPFVLPSLQTRAVPGALVVPHWGWRAATNFQRTGRAPVAPRQIYDDVLETSFRAGATLVDLQLADSRSGYPFAWGDRDPIPRPATWRGGDFWPGWTTQQIALLAREAHHRGMWLQCWLEPPPVVGTTIGDRDYLEAVKWFGRELADARRLGVGAIDGLGVHRWFADDEGISASILRTFHPGAHGYRSDTRNVRTFAAAVDADRGRPAGAPPAGLSANWRPYFPARRFSVGVLDARERRASVAAWGVAAERGGGSYPDWLVTQLADFARPRALAGSAFWWRAHNPATLGPETEEIVHGISMDPLKAAVAGRLTATGTGGYREACARLLGRVQSGFGAESELPCETPFLQNNHVRMHGSGGPVLFDPTGTASFDAAVSGRFMRTKVGGFRPSVESVRSAEVDLIGARPRSAGGYGSTVMIRGADRGGVSFPAALAFEAAPTWPSRVEVSFRAVRGEYALELAHVARDGTGLLELRVDREVLALIPFETGRGSVHESVRVPLASDGEHTLSLHAVHGGVVGISACQLSRVEDRAVQVRVCERAGHCAEICESMSSSYFSEERRWRSIADLSGFLLHTTCRTASRNARVSRVFDLPHHRELSGARETNGKLRSPFVLESKTSGVPDLAVVPFAMPRGARFGLVDGGLELIATPRPHQVLAVGFVFLRDYSADDLDALQVLCRANLDATVLRLGQEGQKSLPPELDVTWPRLLRVYSPARTPFMVREGGRWMFRGGQPTGLDDGSQWLRVYHVPGHGVEIAAWDPARHPVRPGVGSLHSVAIGAPRDGTFDVDVLQTGPLLDAPSVELSAEFDFVRVDGEPWSFFDGSRVMLPCAVGRYAVETGSDGRAATPRLVRTRAIVKRCAYDPATRVLEVFTTRRPEDPDGTMYTAWFAGGEPTDVVGERAVQIPENTFQHQSGVAADAARGAGVIVRFAPGLLRLRY